MRKKKWIILVVFLAALQKVILQKCSENSFQRLDGIHFEILDRYTNHPIEPFVNIYEKSIESCLTRCYHTENCLSFQVQKFEMDHFYCSFYWSKTTRSGTTFTRRENTTAFITPMNLQRLMYSAIVPSCKNQDGGVYLVSLKNQTEEKYTTIRYTLCNGFGREIIGQLKYSKRLFPHASVNGIFTSDFWIGLNALSERTQNTDLVINFKQSKDILGGMHLVAIYKNVTVGRETDSWVFRGICLSSHCYVFVNGY